MKILVTGAKGFVGKNLCAQLNNIKEGKAKCYGNVSVSEVYEYDIDSTADELDFYCRECNFVFNLAGVNRPQNQEEHSQTFLLQYNYVLLIQRFFASRDVKGDASNRDYLYKN